jgi:hypothetical protein
VPILTYVLHSNELSSVLPRCANTASYAVLISGQLKRFVWKDQNAVLIQPTDPACPPTVDVFIAIHNGTMSKPWDGHIDGIPYSTTTTRLLSHYQKRGARHVRIKWITDGDIEKMKLSVESTLGPSMLRSLNQYRQLRWNRYLSMFWLRHVAFTMALGHSFYNSYTYWRDDNLFFAPLQERWLQFHPTEHAEVVVDKWCGFGSFSDKIYVANQPGATLLFDTSFSVFQLKMLSWVKFAQTRGKDPFQTEAFLGHVLSDAKVRKVDLRRADARYVDGKLCLASGYVHCSPTQLGSTIPVCPPSQPIMSHSKIMWLILVASGISYFGAVHYKRRYLAAALPGCGGIWQRV